MPLLRNATLSRVVILLALNIFSRMGYSQCVIRGKVVDENGESLGNHEFDAGLKRFWEFAFSLNQKMTAQI